MGQSGEGRETLEAELNGCFHPAIVAGAPTSLVAIEKPMPERGEAKPSELAILQRGLRSFAQSFDRRKNRISMVGNFDLVPSLGNLACSIDQVRGPDDTHVLPAIHRLLLPHPILGADSWIAIGILGISQERKVELVLIDELPMALFIIGAHSKHDCF